MLVVLALAVAAYASDPPVEAGTGCAVERGRAVELAATEPLREADTLRLSLAGRNNLARVRLVAWEVAIGATTMTGATTYSLSAPLVLVGLGLGGTLGALTPLLLPDDVPVDLALVNGLVGAQQLLMFNAASLAWIADQQSWGNRVPAGLAVGGVVGTGLGLALAITADLDDGEMAAAYSGAFWGMGLAASVLNLSYSWDEEEKRLPALVLGADLGVASAWILAHLTGLSRDEVRMANYGMVFGGVAAYAFAFSTQDSIFWTDGAVTAALTVGALVGGVGGALVVRHFDVSGDRVSLLPPVPSVTPRGGPSLSLVHARF